MSKNESVAKKTQRLQEFYDKYAKELIEELEKIEDKDTKGAYLGADNLTVNEIIKKIKSADEIGIKLVEWHINSQLSMGKLKKR